jgi:hypothetical protein
MKRSGFKPRTTPMKRTRKKAPPKAIADHLDHVRDLGCCVIYPHGCTCPHAMYGHARATAHHVHGGSVSRITKPGMSQKSNDYLTIPLCPALHSMSSEGIDSGKGVLSWENKYGDQFMWLLWTGRQLGVDLFELAGIERPTVV